MSLFAALLGGFLVKEVCKEIRIANQKYINKTLREIEIKYSGSKLEYMTILHPRWNEYCDEVNPVRIKFELPPYEKVNKFNSKDKV